MLSLLAITFFSSSCAYRMGSPDRSLPGGYKQIFIPMFRNKSMEPAIEVAFTNALILEFQKAKIGHVVDEKQAEILIDGVIERVDFNRVGAPVTSDPDQSNNKLPIGTVRTSAYEIVIIAEIYLRKTSDNSILWSGRFVGSRSYSAPSIETAVINTVNPLYNQSARRQNIDAKASEMMAEAHDRITENF